MKKEKSVIPLLAVRFLKENKRQSLLMILTIALSVFMIFSISSIIYGKITIDAWKNIRSNGSTVTAYLENGTKEQLAQIQEF